MLVLTRKLGESIRIGDSIIVKVVDIDSRHVKIGIEAPKSIAVNREEIYERIQKENRAAAQAKAAGLKSMVSAFRTNPPSQTRAHQRHGGSTMPHDTNS